MFWEFGLMSNTIDNLILKTDVTLEEFLDEEDLLQEIKTKNHSLLECFISKNFINKMLNYVLVEPANNLDESVRFKYPTICCEVLTAGVYEFDGIIIENEANLERIFKALANENLNLLMCNFITRLIVYFTHEFPTTILEYLKTSDFQLVDTLLVNIKHMSVCDVIIKLQSNELPQMAGKGFVDLLLKQNLVEKLYNLVKAESAHEKQLSVVHILIEMTRAGRIRTYHSDSQPSVVNGPLLEQMQSEKMLNILFANMKLSECVYGKAEYFALKETILHLCNVLNALFEKIRISDVYGEELSEYGYTNPTIFCNPKTDFSTVSNYLPNIINHIRDDTIGRNSNVLGLKNLGLIKFICTLITYCDRKVNEIIIECKFLDIIWKLFAMYKFNNLLHQVVFNITNYVLFSEHISHRTKMYTNLTEIFNQMSEFSLAIDKTPLASYMINEVQLIIVLMSLMNTHRTKVGYNGYILTLCAKLSELPITDLLPAEPNLSILENSAQNELMAKDLVNTDSMTKNNYITEMWNTYMAGPVSKFIQAKKVDKTIVFQPDCNLLDDCQENYFSAFNFEIKGIFGKPDFTSMEGTPDKDLENSLHFMNSVKSTIYINHEKDLQNDFIVNSDEDAENNEGSEEGSLVELDISDISPKSENDENYKDVGNNEFVDIERNKLEEILALYNSNSNSELILSEDQVEQYLNKVTSYKPLKIEVLDPPNNNKKSNVLSKNTDFSIDKSTNETTLSSDITEDDKNNGYVISSDGSPYDSNTSVIDKNISFSQSVIQNTIPNRMQELADSSLDVITKQLENLEISESVSQNAAEDCSNSDYHR